MKPLFKLCRRGLHEMDYNNSKIDHRGFIVCRNCFNIAHRRRYKRWREKMGYTQKKQIPTDKINHFKVCRLAGMSIDTAVYLVGITEWEGRKIERIS